MISVTIRDCPGMIFFPGKDPLFQERSISSQVINTSEPCCRAIDCPAPAPFAVKVWSWVYASSGLFRTGICRTISWNGIPFFRYSSSKVIYLRIDRCQAWRWAGKQTAPWNLSSWQTTCPYPRKSWISILVCYARIISYTNNSGSSYTMTKRITYGSIDEQRNTRWRIGFIRCINIFITNP